MDSEGLSFFRCMLCSRPVSAWDVRDSGGCSYCGGTRVAPTNLTFIEKVIQIFKHPLIWEWSKHELVPAEQEGQEEIRKDVGSDTDTLPG